MPPRLIIEVLGDTSNLERSFKRASRSSQGFSRTIGQSTRGAVAASLSFRGLGRSVAFASSAFLGGAGLAAVVTSTISKAADFEKSLNVLQAVSHATAGEMRQVSAEAKRLGADVRLPATSAKDAADAMLELSKGGLSVRDTMDAARGSLQLAAAAHVSAAEAAAIQARQLNAFELSGKEATRVADALANTASAASGEIGDFAIAFQQSATIAHRFGLTVEDTAASLGIMAKAGLIGSDAGTSLRVMLGRLVPQTKKASELMADLGIKWQDAEGNIIPFRQQLVQYQAVLSKLNPAQRQQAIYTLFGSDAQRAANIILTRGVGAYDQMLKAVSKQGGAARLAAAQNKGFTGALDALKSALETTQITLGTLLLPVLTKYTRAAAKWLGDTKNQARIQRDFKEALATFGEVLKTVAGVVKTAASVFETFAGLVGGAKNAIKLLGLALLGLKFRGAILGLIGIRTNAAGAAFAVGTLRTKLLAIGRLGAIAIPLTIAIENKDAIDSWFSSHGLGFLNKNVFDIPGDVAGGVKKFVFQQQPGATGPAPLGAADVWPLIGAGTLTPAQLAPLKKRMDPGVFAAAMTYARQVAARTRKVMAGRAGGGKAGATASKLPGAATVPPAALKPLGLAAFIPKSIELAEAMARTEAQERAVAGRKLAVINKRLRGRLAVDDRIALEQEKTSILAGLKSMNDAEASERKSAAAKTAADRKRATAAAKKAITDRAKAALLGLSLHGRKLGVAGDPLTIAQVNKAIAGREQAARLREQGKQFRALGLSSTGGERAPTQKGLLAAIGGIEKGVKGTVLDTKKMQAKLAVMRKIVSDPFKKAGEDVRRTIKGMLADIDSLLKDAPAKGTGFKHISPNKLARQLNLGTDAAGVRRAAAIVSEIGRGGTVAGRHTGAFAGAGGRGGMTVIIHGGQHLHGVQDPRVLQEKLNRLDGRRPQVRRGAR